MSTQSNAASVDLHNDPVTNSSSATLTCAKQDLDIAVEIDQGDMDCGPLDSDVECWPSVWDIQMWQEKKRTYPWLCSANGLLGCEYCREARSLGILAQSGMKLSKQWCDCAVDDGGNSKKSSRLTSLRHKIRKHVTSAAHMAACDIRKNKQEKMLKQQVAKQAVKVEQSTENVFRTAYYLAKNNRPFTDHETLIDLQKSNGMDLGIILHSRFTATNIIIHVANEMRKRLVSGLVSTSSKLSVLIDESTTLSHKSVMVVFLRASLQTADPIFIFLDLVELDSQTAEHIASRLIRCLKNAGFSEDYLQKNWISFVSDGASVMLGKKSGVASRLRGMYPAIFSWHCMNHRLELAVADAIKDVSAVNHFKCFLDCIYSLFSQSNKNQRALREACKELEVQFLQIGRVLDMRWVSSSLRTVRAIWTCYSALFAMFSAASTNENEYDSQSRKKMNGLAKKLASVQFVADISLMYDILQELSTLSLSLQKNSMTLDQADRLVKRTIRVVQSFKDNPGEHVTEAVDAIDLMEFKGVVLSNHPKLVSINKGQFIQSIVDNLQKRLCDLDAMDAQILADSQILDVQTWPQDPEVRFGEKEIRRLCHRFHVDAQEAVEGMRDFVEDSSMVPDALKSLSNCLKTLPCSTAECERGFSLMNIISTDLRASLLVENIASLMFVNMNGPPLHLWKPEPYVKSWMQTHRSATDNQSKKRQSCCSSELDKSRQILWELF